MKALGGVMRIRRKTILATASFWLLAACGGGGPTYSLTGSATITGTVFGLPIAAADAISNVIPAGSSGSAGAILISTATNQCNLVNAHQQLKNGRAIAIVMGTQTGNTVAPPTLGTYNVVTTAASATAQGKVASALFAATNASCGATNSAEAATGTSTLTRVDATGYTGTLDATFNGTDHVTGSFNTGTCSTLGTSGPASCPP
jgi:hypothetical protein